MEGDSHVMRAGDRVPLFIARAPSDRGLKSSSGLKGRTSSCGEDEDKAKEEGGENSCVRAAWRKVSAGPIPSPLYANEFL